MTNQATDPVCKMTVDPTTAKYSSTYNGVTYYFCSQSCKTSFDANPTAYISFSPDKTLHDS